MALDAIIFDLDGTLIDSAPDITAAVNKYLAETGWPMQNTKSVAKFIGYGPRSLLCGLFTEIGHPTDSASLDRAHGAYIENYRAAPAERSRFFPHVREDLLSLVRAGIGLGICTNKPHELTLKVIKALGLSEYFDTIIGADFLPVCKPDRRHLLEVAKRMGLDGTHWVYVGDTVVDQKTARNAHAEFYTVPWGGGANLDVPASKRLSRLSDLLQLKTISEKKGK